jgi:RNA polymerase sigma-70 factor (ECF subfamily)
MNAGMRPPSWVATSSVLSEEVISPAPDTSAAILPDRGSPSAVHDDAPTAAQTDWAQIVALYDQLLAISPTPIVALNRAVAVAEIDGPQVALELIDALRLEQYYLFHAIRANLLRRLGHAAQAEAAYRAAIERTENAAEIAFMEEQIAAIGRP